MNSTTSNSSFLINKINAFNDNYIWCIEQNDKAILVDPGDASVCIRYLEENQLNLHAILITHRHNDHIGGVQELRDYCKTRQLLITVYGPTKEALDVSDIKVSNDEKITLDEFCFDINVLDIGGHTIGHIGYLINDNLFCGDTLFSGGCGRIFDGSSEQLFESLSSLSKLPEKTHVYCAHEYTEANLNFALTVDPTNDELINYYNSVKQLRNNNRSTIPTSIHIEKRINPFLRCYNEHIKSSVESYSNTLCNTPVEVFTALRRWKDVF